MKNMREAKRLVVLLLGGGNFLDIIDSKESRHCTNNIHYFTKEPYDDAAVRMVEKKD